MRRTWLTLAVVLVLGHSARADEAGAKPINSGCDVQPTVCCQPDPCCDICCNRPRLYGGLEYIMQWFENQRVPPLVVIAPPRSPLGIPTGVPGERVLYGNQPIDFGGLDGIRATAGYWLDEQQCWALEASGFLTERVAETMAVVHNGAATNPVLLGRTDGTFAIASVIGAPGLSRGGVAVSQTTQLWGAESNLVMNWAERSRWRTDVLAGLRYLDLDESLDVGDFTTPLVVNPPIAARLESFDSRTQFYGGQVGSKLSAAWGPMSLSLIGKLGVGNSHLAVQRTGQSLPPSPFGGPLVTPFNAGRDTTDRLAALSETTIQVGWHWSKCMAWTVSYNVIYLTSAARVGDQIGPFGGINATDFYANGITFGLACRY